MLRKLAKTSAALMLVLMIPACTTMGSGETSRVPVLEAGMSVITFCSTYKPVRWSKTDTVETVKQTKENNRGYKELCQ